MKRISLIAMAMMGLGTVAGSVFAAAEARRGQEEPAVLGFAEWMQRHPAESNPRYYRTNPNVAARLAYEASIPSYDEWLKHHPFAEYPQYYDQKPAREAQIAHDDYLKGRIISFDQWLLNNPGYAGDQRHAKSEYDFHVGEALGWLQRGGQWPQTPEERQQITAVKMFKSAEPVKLRSVKMAAQARPVREAAEPAGALLTFKEWLKQYPEKNYPKFYDVEHGGRFGQEREVVPSAEAKKAYRKYNPLQSDTGLLTFAEWLQEHPEHYVLMRKRGTGERSMKPKDSAQDAYQAYAAQKLQENAAAMRQYYK